MLRDGAFILFKEGLIILSEISEGDDVEYFRGL
jgi:hypothetical protein